MTMVAPRVLLVDNYDSFTYNLYQYLAELGAEVRVFRNDAVTVEEAHRLAPSHVVISPGPGGPGDAGVSTGLLKSLEGRVPVLGVCLGFQCLGAVYGGRVGPAARPIHGKASEVFHDGAGVFRGLPNPFMAMRYHSLVVEERGLPEALEVTARTREREIMGLRVRGVTPLMEGVQFHPESILTAAGKDLIRNFLDGSQA